MKKQFLFCIALTVAVLFIFSYTNWDTALQDRFYDSTLKEWVISRAEHAALSPFFYKGFKIFIGTLAALCLIFFLLSFKKKNFKPYRASFLMLLLSIIFVPVLVAGTKKLTNEYCPKQVERYGGVYPYVRLLEPYPSNFVQVKKGKCFPGGHSTSGFCLMALYFCFRNKKYRRFGLAAGIFAGWITGNYQMLRGEHYISHTIISMIASWMVILLIYYFLRSFYSDPANPQHADNNSQHQITNLA